MKPVPNIFFGVAAALTIALVVTGCDFMETPTRVEPDPRLYEVGPDPSIERCAASLCTDTEVCADNVGGKRCVDQCVVGSEDCGPGRMCLEATADKGGCFDTCDLFDNDGCGLVGGCLPMQGRDGICVLRGDDGLGRPCTDTAQCLGNLVCELGACSRACLEGAAAGAPGGCGTGVCSDVSDGVGICTEE